MGVSLSDRVVKNDDIVFRKIEDEYILVPMLKSSDEVEHIFNLNKVGADIWERIDGSKTVGQIIDEMLDEYDADPDVIRKDVLEFLSDILEAKIIVVTDAGD